jgi:hypothetical protein
MTSQIYNGPDAVQDALASDNVLAEEAARTLSYVLNNPPTTDFNAIASLTLIMADLNALLESHQENDDG